jgi:hypothetical protein
VASLLAARYRRDDSSARVKKAIQEDAPISAAMGSPGGDERDLRMIPVIGPGIASEIPFTRPDRAIVRLDGRG